MLTQDDYKYSSIQIFVLPLLQPAVTSNARGPENTFLQVVNWVH